MEHHSLYQYQIANAQNIFAGFIQTETPYEVLPLHSNCICSLTISSCRYYQPNPDVKHSPYPTNATLYDPDYSSCVSGNCDALGMRILNGINTLIYGAGFYSFFNNYNTTCSNYKGPENCQSDIFRIDGNTNNVWAYALSTVGSESMVTVNGTSVARYSDNINVFPATIARFTYNV